MEDAKNLWTEINDRFSVANGPQIQQLKSDLAECKQHDMTIIAYYGRIKKKWDEQANYEKVPMCTCVGCKCNIGAQLEKRREEEKVHQFLMRLDDMLYGTVRTNMLAADPLPTLNRVYSILIQQERVNTNTHAKEERGEVIGLAVQTNSKTRGCREVKDKSMTCTHCKRSRHEAEFCFQLISYPNWRGDRPRGEKWTSTKGKGLPQLQRTGSGTGRGQGRAVRANVVQTTTGGARRSGTSGTPTDMTNVGLSNEQWMILRDMVNNHKTGMSERMTGKHDKILRIIDTGASNHMIANLKCMTDLHQVVGCPVGLPDGQHTIATKKGSIKLSENQKLENVLFVSHLKCNLISASPLIDQVDCIVQFTKNLCVMQGRTSRMLLGAGE